MALDLKRRMDGRRAWTRWQRVAGPIVWAWRLVTLVVIVALVAAVMRIPALRAPFAPAAILGALGLAAALWGADSRDGLDWAFIGSRPGGQTRRPPSKAGDEANTKTMSAEYEGGDRFSIRVRGHRMAVDEPLEDAEGDSAPTPVEVLVASLTGCMAITAERYLRKHGIEPEGLRLETEFAMSEDPPRRVGSIRVRIEPPEGFPGRRRAAMLAAVRRCTVHNSIAEAPDIGVEVDRPDSAAA
jgi:uncharacterized OsmC-like protein